MIEYLRATASDRTAMLDFGNMVFSMASRPHDFKTLIPKFYGDGMPSENKSFLAKEDGRIRAMIAICERPMRIAGETLKVGFVGTVSSHPYDRGKGHMSHLLRMVNEDAAASGVDLMALGGKRQRYGHYGFEPCETQIKFTIDHANILHCFRNMDISGIRFDEIISDKDARLDTAFSLYDAQPIAGMRTRENFLVTARTWHERLYAIEEDGDMIGYMIGGGNEIVLKDEGKLPLVLAARDAFTGGKSAVIPCAPHEVARISFLSDISENMAIEAGHLVNILHFGRVISALMTLKPTFTRLADGRFVLGIVDGERLLIEVKDGQPHVEETDETPDLILPKRNAEMLLLSPASYVLPLPCKLKNWLPLPLFIPGADSF